jgi:hypothetical protein
MNIEQAKVFIRNAHNAVATLSNAATARHFTFRFSVSDEGNLVFVHLLTSPETYSYLGCIGDKGFFLTKKSCAGADAMSVKALKWLVSHIDSGTELPAGVEFRHSGSCCRCGRELTNPASLDSGIGPECAKKGSFTTF